MMLDARKIVTCMVQRLSDFAYPRRWVTRTTRSLSLEYLYDEMFQDQDQDQDQGQQEVEKNEQEQIRHSHDTLPMHMLVYSDIPTMRIATISSYVTNKGEATWS